MAIFYLEALAAIAVSLAVLMAVAWMVQQRTGNSGWVDTIWTFSLEWFGWLGDPVIGFSTDYP
jgi:steroid 5-alpha reductase family enzyme